MESQNRTRPDLNLVNFAFTDRQFDDDAEDVRNDEKTETEKLKNTESKRASQSEEATRHD